MKKGGCFRTGCLGICIIVAALIIALIFIDPDKNTDEPVNTIDVDAYVSQLEEIMGTNEPATEKVTEKTEPETVATEMQVQPDNGDSNEIRPEFKAALDSYEDFFEKYCDIMKKFADNPADISIIKDYTEYLGKYAEMSAKLDAMGDEEMNDAELKYYLEVTGRITAMLADVAV